MSDFLVWVAWAIRWAVGLIVLGAGIALTIHAPLVVAFVAGFWAVVFVLAWAFNQEPPHAR